MNKLSAIITLLLLIGSTLTSSAQKNESWREYSPYEITAGINFSTPEFYDLYSYFNNDANSFITTNTLQTPSFNLGCTYKLNRLITLGVIATYVQANYAKTATYDNALIQEDKFKYISLAPRIRLDWLNRKYFTLYSSFALGVGVVSEKETVHNTRRCYTSGYIEATYVGVKVGRSLFGFFDIASSSTGAMRIGMGYNFKSKE